MTTFEEYLDRCRALLEAESPGAEIDASDPSWRHFFETGKAPDHAVGAYRLMLQHTSQLAALHDDLDVEVGKVILALKVKYAQMDESVFVGKFIGFMIRCGAAAAKAGGMPVVDLQRSAENVIKRIYDGDNEAPAKVLS